jgi:tetratricopeptide (TPR) repeat protein
MTRLVLLLALLVVYGAYFGQRVLPEGPGRLDPVGPQARQIERAIAESRFAEARRIAEELRGKYASEPLLAYWFALIYHGLDRPQDETEWWETFIALGGAAAEACPQLADANARLGDSGKALNAYERCASFDPAEPERLIDLGDAYQQAGQLGDALGAFQRAATLDPGNLVIGRRIERLAPVRPEKP